MPNQRAPPAPTGITSVRQQLRRRLNGQTVLARAVREAARQLQERFRRTPRAAQEETTTQPPHCRRKTPTISPSDATPTISPSDAEPTIPPFEAEPTTSPSEAESTTPAPATDQTLDLEREVIDGIDAALAGMDSPAPSPAARPPSPQPAAPTRTPTPGPPASEPAPEEFYDWMGREEGTTNSDRGQHPQALRLPCPESLCWRCGVPGHSRGACRAPAVLFCSRCGTLGLMSRDCTRTARSPTESTKVMCTADRASLPSRFRFRHQLRSRTRL
jgi:hypothetical protein